MRVTSAEKVHHLAQNKTARIERVGGDHYLVFNDVEWGLIRYWISAAKAKELIALGLQDARNDQHTIDEIE